MTKDDIIRMAREAGFEKVVAIHPDGSKTVTVAPVLELLVFANLVAAAERKPLTATTIVNMMPSQIPSEYDGALMEFARAIEAAHGIKEQP